MWSLDQLYIKLGLILYFSLNSQFCRKFYGLLHSKKHQNFAESEIHRLKKMSSGFFTDPGKNPKGTIHLRRRQIFHDF